MPIAAADLSPVVAAIASPARQGPAMLVVGLAALFVCSRMLAAILPRGRHADEGIGLRAFAYFVPIAAASLIAMLLGRPEIALGIVFGTSVGSLTTVVGFVALGSPVEGGPARWRRVWPFQIFAALLVFVSGFAGTFKWREAVGLLTEGLILLGLWSDRSTRDEPAQATTTTTTTRDVLDEAAARAPTLPYARPGTVRPSGRDRVVLALELLLIAALLWLGGVMAAQGAVRVYDQTPRFSTSAIAGSLISIALIMPMTYGQWRRTAGGRAWASVTTQFGVVMLNLCALLPVLILIPYLADHVPQIAHFAGDAFTEGNGVPRLLVFPAPMWRVDTTILIVAGVFLLPVALGKWALNREEGMILIAAYFFYLVVTAASGMDFRFR
jgi:Ca2+/Na+ antiporter